MRLYLLLLCLLALPSFGATLSTTTCTSTVKTGCAVLDISALNQLPSTVGVQLSGAWTGTILFEGSVNGTSYVAVTARPVAGGSWTSLSTSNGVWAADVAGMLYFRVRASELTSGAVTVHLAPSTARPMVDVVRAVGSTFGEVQVSGSVSAALTQDTISALGPQPYTLKPGDWVLVGSTTATPVPPDLPDGGPGTLAGRSELRIINASATADVACDPATADGGLPQWGVRGTPLFSGGGYGTWEVRDNVRVYCRAHTGTNVPMAPLEKSQ